MYPNPNRARPTTSPSQESGTIAAPDGLACVRIVRLAAEAELGVEPFAATEDLHVTREQLGNILACESDVGPPGRRAREPGSAGDEPAARRRLAFLAEASANLATSLDYEVTLRRVARLAVPRMADWCVIDTLDEDGSVRLLAVAHVDPNKEELVRELRRRYPPSPRARYGLRKVLESGHPELYADILPAWRRAAARDAEHLALMEALDARSSLCVPLRARGETLGAMTFVCAASGRRYGPPDLELAQDLADRCALALDNARLHGRLQETLRTRERFLASLVHDLKAPLTGMLGYAQLVRREAAKTGPPATARRLADWAGIIESNGAQATALLDELLDIARLEAGESLELERRPADLVQMARRAVESHHRSGRRHRLSVDGPEPALIGEWDAVRLARVLDNLLGNAIKYSPDGGEITVGVAREGPWAVLTVADQGMGIPAADRSSIFDLFHRGRNATGHVAGTGIGLAGVKQVVEQHGGSISFESQEGAGTTFTVRLPLTEATRAGSGGPEQEPELFECDQDPWNGERRWKPRNDPPGDTPGERPTEVSGGS